MTEKQTTPQQPILSVRNLKQHFKSGFGKKKLIVKAVDDVSFDIYKGEVFSLVGESGCGKTTTGRTIIQLYEPTDGEVYFLGKRISAGYLGLKNEIKEIRKNTKDEIAKLKTGSNNESEIKRLHDEAEKRIDTLNEEIEIRKKETRLEDKEHMKNMQMIFQDPIASLNPRMVVKEIIAEGLRIANIKDKQVINDRVNEMLETVGLVREHASRYPHEFSGGQRQRIGIARALAVSPQFIIADEPISALDVSIQAQVINLLNDLRDEFGITIMFIAHDLSVVKYFSDRIAVMYYGKLVELTTKEELFANPLHPYTKSLLSAVPLPDPIHERTRQRIVYDPRMHDYSKQGPSLHEIKPGHFIYANDEELAGYKKELGI
jgi:oligopeptide transport system ATP-binding protein